MPLLEIATFVLVGGEIGVLPTIGLVLATSILGSILLRVQGFTVIGQIRRALDVGQVPGRELVNGVMIVVAGILLLIPGFITDTLGLLLFIPAVRNVAWRFLRSRVTFISPPGGMRGRGSPGAGGTPAQGPRTIDLNTGEYSKDGPGSSPWRRLD